MKAGEREDGREGEVGNTRAVERVCVFAFVCVFERERERKSVLKVRVGVDTVYTLLISVYITKATQPLSADTDSHLSQVGVKGPPQT